MTKGALNELSFPFNLLGRKEILLKMQFLMHNAC